MGGRPRSAGIYPIPHWWQHPGFKSSYIREFVRFGGFACCFFRGRGRPLCLWMESAWPVGCLVDGTQGGWWFSHGSCGGLTLFLHPVGGIRSGSGRDQIRVGIGPDGSRSGWDQAGKVRITYSISLNLSSRIRAYYLSTAWFYTRYTMRTQ